MASSYEGFAVTTIDANGVQVSVGAGINVDVRVEGAVADVAESPLTTNSDGEIVAGSLAAVAVGTVVHFRVELYEGVAASASQITT